MGKRELVLIAVFLVLGILVYEVTAPPPPAGSEGFSVSGLFRNMKRGIQGTHESATASSTQTFPVEAGVRQIRVNLPRNGDLTITGTDRSDVSAQMSATARGFDQAEAKAMADGARLTMQREGDGVVVTAAFPTSNGRGPHNGFVSEAAITIAIPRGLAVWIAPHNGKLVVSDVASSEILGARADTRVSGVAGQVTLSHFGPGLDIDNVGGLKFTGRNSRGNVRHVHGTTSLDTVGGELTLSDITGPLEIEGRNSDFRIDGLKGLKPPLRANATGGRLRIDGLGTEARIDGRNTEIEVSLSTAAPITIYSTGEDVTVAPPPSGYTLDAVATDGHISIDDGSIKPTGEDDQRASGSVRGGGSTLTLRVTHGRLIIRRPPSK